MAILPINKRQFRTFLSHAHSDKAFVDKLYAWLTDFVGLRVWYDSLEFPTGLVASELGRAIENCQSAILVLTQSSVSSGWVEEEWNICIEQKHSNPDFQVIVLNLDNTVPPAALRARKWIPVADGKVDPSTACQIIEALHLHETRPWEAARGTFYLSRGARAPEVETSEKWLSRCRNAGFRFVRDSPDQFSFSELRIKNLIASTSGVFAFVPDRGDGSTSKYVLDEVRFAKELNVPAFVLLQAGLTRSALDGIASEEHVVVEEGALDADQIDMRLQDFLERVRPPLRGAHCFLGHEFATEDRSVWGLAKRIVEVVTGLPCYTGDDLIGEAAQQQIVHKIADSAIAIFDISEDRLNTCIEAGVARGAGSRYELICKAPRRRPPFLFRDKQVFFYETTTELLGLVRKLVFDLRRVVT